MKAIPTISLLALFCVAPVTNLAQVTTLNALTNGLVAYYPFNGNADDVSGSGNHGLAVGAVLTTDRFGREAGAYQFSGSNSYVLVPPHAALNMISNFASLSVWIKMTVPPSSSLPVYIINAYPGECTLGLISGPSPAGFATNEVFFPSWLGIAHHPLSVGRYYNIVATSSNRWSSVFIDGVLVWRTNNVGALFLARNSEWTIGARLIDALPYSGFTGVIDDVRLYNRALSATEVADLYQLESVAPFAPSLAIQVKTVRVSMLVQPGEKYQLETSSDLAQWAPYGIPFTASAHTMFTDVEVLNGAQYFRINQVP